MRSLDLRARLLIAFGLLFAVQVGLGFAIIGTTRAQLLETVDDRLAVASGPDSIARPGDAGGIPGHDERGERGEAPALDPQTDPNGLDALPNSPATPERLGDTFQGALTQDGTLIATYFANSTGTDLAAPAISIEDAEKADGQPFTVDSTGDSVRYRAVAVASTNGYFISAIPLTEVNTTMARLQAVILGAGAAVFAMLMLVTGWVLRLGINPIKRMTRSATAIADGDLSERITDTDESTEAGRLGSAFNTMLGQIEESFAERTRTEDRLRQFVADASHELRTPVATIRGYAELYRFGGLDSKEALDDAMRRTEQESQRMSRLIADLLDLAKLDRDAPSSDQPKALELAPVDLVPVLSDVINDARVANPERTIVGPELSSSGPFVLSGDEDRLRQVATNIIGNALVHTDDATVTISLVEQPDGVASIVCSDNGPGMEPAVASRVTERFFRQDVSRSRQRGGSGLGLSIAEAAVAAHDGSLEVASELGEGTRVTVKIPLLR